MIPWGIIFELGMRILNMFFKEGEKKTELTRRFVSFIKSHSETVIRAAYHTREIRRLKNDLRSQLELERLSKAINDGK